MSWGKLLAIAGTIIAITAVLFLTVFRADVVTSETEIRIEVPPGELWRVIADPAQRPQWMDGIEDATMMIGDPGAYGATMLLRLKVDDFTTSVFEDVTERDAPFLLRTRTTDNESPLSVERTYRFVPDGPDTQLAVTEVRDLSGSMATYFAWFLQSRHDTQLTENLARLKALAETR